MSNRNEIYRSDDSNMVKLALEAATHESENSTTTTGEYMVEREGNAVFLSESSGRTLHPEEVLFFTDYIAGWIEEELKKPTN